MIYLYALTGVAPEAAMAAVADVDAVAGPVSATDFGVSSLLWSAAPDAPILPRRRLLLAHARVLEAAMSAGPVLPLRFGVLAEALDDVGRMVAAAADRVGPELARLGHRAEYGLRIALDETAALEAVLAADPLLRAHRDRLRGGGAELHQERIAFGRSLGERLSARRAEAQRQLIRAIAPAADDHVLKSPESDTEVLRADFLLAPDREEDFSRAVEAAVAACPLTPPGSATIRLVGPSPAYNFVRLALDPGVTRSAA